MIPIMNTSSIAMLQALRAGVLDLKALQHKMHLSKSRFYSVLKDLIEGDYIERSGSKVALKQNSKTILFRDIDSYYNAEKLLHDSNEKVFLHLIEPVTINELQHLTGLSIATIQRSLTELQSIGAITKDQLTNRFSVSKNDPKGEKLYYFAQVLKTEKLKKEMIEPYVQIIFQSNSLVLKKVPAGKKTDGQLSGFSLFTEYGVEYHTTYDYYAKQQTDLTLQDVLLHAVISAVKDKDKNGMVMAAIFYLKNKSKLDPLSIRKGAKVWGIASEWLDIESFIRNNEPSNQELFPSRKEFEEKAKLYGIGSDLFDLPAGYPDLFKDMGNRLKQPIEVFLIGGENMRLKGLKARTKDLDIVVKDDKTLNDLFSVLGKMGYKRLGDISKLSEGDIRLGAFTILEHPTRSRIDVFHRFIGRNQFYLSDRMIQRAEIEVFGKLRLGLVSVSDIFLLKGIAAREGDIDDMATIVRQRKDFSWKIVWDELVEQENETGLFLSAIFLDGIDFLVEHKNIKPPFYQKLVRRVLDKEIGRALRNGEKPLREVVLLLEGKDISEKTIRHRIDYLEKKKYLKKITRRGEVYLVPKKQPAFP